VNILSLYLLPSSYFFVPVLVYFDPKHASRHHLAGLVFGIFDPSKFIFEPRSLFDLDIPWIPRPSYLGGIYVAATPYSPERGKALGDRKRHLPTIFPFSIFHLDLFAWILGY
jgi:hypothetical protein